MTKGKPGAPTNERPTRFFISYRRRASEDARLAKFLKDGLETRGNEVFIDTRMRVGTDWAAEIDRRIRWCDCLVVLLSAESVQSEMVQGEIRRAYRYRGADGRPIILPVRVHFDGPLDYELDSYLARTQYTLWESDDDSACVLEELSAAAETPGILEGKHIECEVSEPPSFAPQKPLPSIDPRLLRAPGGTIRVDSQLYVRRLPADNRIEAAAQQGNETVVIKGPRQVGKSSLLIRYLKACADAGRRFAFFDFQILNNQQLDDYPTLLTEIARKAARGLRVQLDVEPDLGGHMQLTNFIEDTLMPTVGGPITLAFDEVDRVLGRPYQSDFFSMLRLWHNQRAEPFSVWDVDLALVISTEPYLLIDSADRSPFNVTAPIELGPFSRQSLDELNTRYNGTLSAAQLDRLFQLLGGQPYLTRLAYFRLLVDPGMSFDELNEKADDISGPFGEHLRAKLFWLGRKKELLGAFKQVINNRSVPNEDTYLRLRGAGLAVRDGEKTLPSNLLYARFFKKAAA